MEPHPIPRQITTFEFKLIGFLTLKQFIYIAIFSGVALILFYLVPIPLLNILFAGISVFLGVALAFFPINERPLDIFIRNFLKKLFSASQYYYIKKNQAPAFLNDIVLYNHPRVVQTHIEAAQKLSGYLKTQTPPATSPSKKQLLTSPSINPQPFTPTKTIAYAFTPLPQQIIAETQATIANKPFFLGSVTNSKHIPLPNILVYVKNQSGQNVRILKTNHNGVFATFHPLAAGNYTFDLKDLGNRHFFDTMNIDVAAVNEKPLVFTSKEVL